MSDFRISEVPEWAGQQTGPADDYDGIELTVALTPYAVSLSPDAFNWWLAAELEGLKGSLLGAYYEQRRGDSA